MIFVFATAVSTLAALLVINTLQSGPLAISPSFTNSLPTADDILDSIVISHSFNKNISKLIPSKAFFTQSIIPQIKSS